MKNILKLALFLLPMTVLAQPPQVPMNGNIGSNFNGPLINSPAIIFATDADHTMVYPEMSGDAAPLIVTSSVTLTATRNLFVPNTGNFTWPVKNMTTGGQTINVLVSGGTSVPVANGQTVTVVCDGTNCTAGGTLTAVTGTPPLDCTTSGSSVNCAAPTAVVTDPSATQTITQPVGTTLFSNGNTSIGPNTIPPNGVFGITQPVNSTTYPGTGLATHSISDSGLIINGDGYSGCYPTDTSQCAYAEYDVQARLDGATDYNHFVGMQIRPIYNGTGGISDRWWGLETNAMTATSTSSGTISTAGQVHLRDVVNSSSSTVITNDYGLKIDPIINGVNNYAISTLNGEVFLGGSQTYVLGNLYQGMTESGFIPGGVETSLNGPVGINMGNTALSNVMDIATGSGGKIDFHFSKGVGTADSYFQNFFSGSSDQANYMQFCIYQETTSGHNCSLDLYGDGTVSIGNALTVANLITSNLSSTTYGGGFEGINGSYNFQLWQNGSSTALSPVWENAAVLEAQGTGVVEDVYPSGGLFTWQHQRSNTMQLSASALTLLNGNFISSLTSPTYGGSVEVANNTAAWSAVQTGATGIYIPNSINATYKEGTGAGGITEDSYNSGPFTWQFARTNAMQLSSNNGLLVNINSPNGQITLESATAAPGASFLGGVESSAGQIAPGSSLGDSSFGLTGALNIYTNNQYSGAIGLRLASGVLSLPRGGLAAGTKMLNGSAVETNVCLADGTGGCAVLNLANNFTIAGAASTPAMKLSGAWFQAGSGTTTKPQLLIEPAGTTSTGWHTQGTGIGINVPSSSAYASAIDAQADGVSLWRLDAAGNVHTNSAAPTSSLGSLTGSNAGGFVSGLTAATAVTITFAASPWAFWASCTATPSVTGITVYNSAQSTASVTFSMAALTGTLYYSCTGN